MAIKKCRPSAIRIDSANITPATLKLVLRSIDDYARRTGVCFAEVLTLADETCLSERTVRRAIQGLESQGLIKVERRQRRTSLIYICWDAVRLPATVAVQPTSETQVSLQPCPSLPATVTSLTATVTSLTATVAPESNRSERETKVKRNVSAKKKFIPPSLDEIKDHWRKHRLLGDPEAFYNHWESVEWKRSGQLLTQWWFAAKQWKPLITSGGTHKPNRSAISKGTNYDPDNDNLAFM